MTPSNIEQQRAALADKLAALTIPPDVAEMVRLADSAVAGIRSEAAELQAQIDVLDSQLGLREIDRRANAEKAHQAKAWSTWLGFDRLEPFLELVRLAAEPDFCEML